MYCPKPPEKKNRTDYSKWLRSKQAGLQKEGTVYQESGKQEVKCGDPDYSEENHNSIPKPDFNPKAWEDNPVL